MRSRPFPMAARLQARLRSGCRVALLSALAAGLAPGLLEIHAACAGEIAPVGASAAAAPAPVAARPAGTGGASAPRPATSAAAANAGAATAAAASAAAHQTWRRQVGVRFKGYPEGLVSVVMLQVEVPAAYPICVAPTTLLAGSPRLETTTFTDRRIVTLVATYPEPYNVPEYLCSFSIEVDSPDELPKPLIVRDFVVVLGNGQPSKVAEVEVLIQSHPSGQYGELP